MSTQKPLIPTSPASFKFAVVSIRAPDVAQAADFYQHVIDLPVLSHHPSRPHFQLDEAILVLLQGTPHPAKDPQPEHFPLFAISVPDLDEAVLRLRGHQISLPWNIECNPNQSWVMFYDPAGNLVKLVQRMKGK